MLPSPPSSPAAERQFRATDVALALLISLVMTTAWTMTAWADLSRLILPTADDIVRLAQVRDWLNGQAFNDWTQYRMAPPNGTDMHWSRLADLGPAAIILILTPLMGQHGAELAAVIAWPAMLFVVMIVLNIAMGRRLWGASGGTIAALLTAIAYPGTTLFAPGRIDHHGLQAISIALAVLALMQAPGWRWGAVAGGAIAFSLMIGLETVPQAVLLIGCAVLFWIVSGEEERTRLFGVAGALAGVTGLFAVALRPSYWPSGLCDAFTPASTSAILCAAAAIGAMAVLSPKLADWRWRIGAGAALGIAALATTLLLFPACTSFPYGAVDPLLHSYFLAFIDEAVSVFQQESPARAVSLIGPVAVASLVGLVMIARSKVDWRLMLPVLVVVAISTAVMLVQLRGVYIGGPLIPPILAGLVIAARGARRFQGLAIAGAWIAAAGISYLELPKLAERTSTGVERPNPINSPQHDCRTDAVWPQVDAQPAGTVMAPINMAAYLLGMTRHSIIGSGYHRNNRGTLAMYRYFLSTPDKAAQVAREWQVDYVAFCPGDFTEGHLVERYPDSVAALLDAGKTPDGLEPVPLKDVRLRLYRVRR
jgi:hypothetical protein